MSGARETLALRTALPGRRLVSRGLPALIISGAILLAAVWFFTLQLASTLGRTHVEAKMADVATRAEEILGRHAALDAQARQELADLARFRDVMRLEVRAGDGRLLWRNHHSVSRVKRALPAPGGTLVEERVIDGLPRMVARHHALARLQGAPVHLVLEADVTNLLAGYRAVAVLVAKAISTVVLAALFLLGWMLMVRAREQEELLAQLKALEAPAQGKARDEAPLLAELERMNARNAALLRRMAALSRQRGEQHAAADDDAATVDNAAAPMQANGRH